MINEEKQKALEAALGHIEKQYGKGSVMKLGDSSSNMVVEAVPTGSLGLDIALGVGGVPKADLMVDVSGYMGIIYAGLLVTAAYNTLAAFLRALGDSKSPLYFLIISAGINVVLDIVLIRFAGMGV